MIFQHIVFVLLLLLVVVTFLCQTNALSIQHKFPQTKYGNRRSILQSEGFSSAIAFLDELHKERYSNNIKCPILGSSWKEYDNENNGSEKSYSLNLDDDDPESVFTSYSVKDQRRDNIPSSKSKHEGKGNIPQKGFGASNASQSNNHSTAKFDRKSAISKDTIDHGPLMPPTLFGQNFCHVTNVPIFTAEECQAIIYEVETRNAGESNVWKSHEQYYKSMKITRRIGKELPNTRDFLRKACIERIFPLLQQMYPIACPQGVDGLRDFRIFSAKVLKYDASTLNDYLGVHHDGSLMTFLIALNKLDEYEGGGTYIEPLGRSIRYEQGHLLCHPGIIRHGGDKVWNGVRYVLAVWIDIYGVKEYDRQLCEEADLIRLGGRLDQSISLENKTTGGIIDGVSEKAEKYYLYSLAAGELFSCGSTSYIDANLCPRSTSENAWIGLGQLWLDQGSSAKASNAFKNALDLNPYNNRAWNSYGLSLIDLGEFDGALTAFQTAANLNDYEFEALSNLGLLQSMLERHTEAIETFEKAVKRLQQNKDGSIKADKRSAAELYTNMGVTLCDLGRYNEAMVVFAKAVVIDSTFYDAARNLQAVREAIAK
jgi:Tfp pilus assembly protein PilF